MRKNITSLLQRGNLKPKERVLLLVANQVSKEKDGKSILTEAEEYALSEGWIPANEEELREYNRYNEGWRLTGFAELDAQTTFLMAENNFLRVSKIVDYLLLRDKGVANIIPITKKSDIGISENEALELIIKNSGLEVDKVIYTYAFESLSEDFKKDILALDPNAKTKSRYLDQEEILANFFDGRNELTKEAKEKLANLILDSLYYEFINPYHKFINLFYHKFIKQWWHKGYFASLPVLDILKKWADYNEIYTEKEVKELERKGDELIEKELSQKLEDYAEKNKKDIRDLLKETILKWLDEGLFIKEYTPIFNSDETKTYKGKGETKLPHKEVFKEWLKAKKKAKETIQGLIDKGKLKIEERNWEIKGINFKKPLKIITGESLYNFKGDYVFVKDFKKEVETFKGLGALILFLRKCRFIKDYAILLAFKELFKKLSKIYEIDLTYKIDKWIENFKKDIDELNQLLILIEQKISLRVYRKHNLTFLKETFFKDMLIDLEKIKPSDDIKRIGKEEIRLVIAGIDRYYQEFKKLFGEEF